MTLISLDHPDDAYLKRAYTRIDLNRAIVGNRWLERTWSAFFGTTSSVMQKAGNVEWAAQASPEFSFKVNGELCDPQSLDEISISDDASEMGAAVSIKKTKGDFDAIYTSTALHEYPVILRTFKVVNSGKVHLTLTDICTEHLVWDSPKVECWVHKFTETESGNWSATGDDANLSIQIGEKGIIKGVLAPGTLHLEQGETPVCRATASESVTIPPLQTWTGPLSYIIAFEGDPYDAHALHHTALINELRLQEKRAEDIRRMLAEEN